MNNLKYVCQKCNKKMNYRPDVCPKCGNKKMNIFLHVEDRVVVRNQLQLKNKGGIARKRRILYEQKVGDDYYRKEDKWNYLNRIIDHVGDRYYELIKDGETGKIIRSIEEKLSKHWGCGSAKYKK